MMNRQVVPEKYSSASERDQSGCQSGRMGAGEPAGSGSFSASEVRAASPAAVPSVAVAVVVGIVFVRFFSPREDPRKMIMPDSLKRPEKAVLFFDRLLGRLRGTKLFLGLRNFRRFRSDQPH